MSVFLTGCDSNHEWMNEWFLDNYRLHNSTPILFADFGVSDDMREWCEENFDGVLDLTKSKGKGWFKKPEALQLASKFDNKICWMDNDCEVLGDMSSIFDLTQPNKLGMTHDRAWIKRKKEEWFSSGLVVFEGRPQILNEWVIECVQTTERGDQEVLHAMLKDPLSRLTHINLIPNKYQYTRLQVLIDGEDDPHKLMIHWTGPKGKEIIKGKINESKHNR